MGITINFGDEPMEILIRELTEKSIPRSEDLLYALNRQKSRILERTARGVDLNGRSFAPYSTRGPYYYYPGGASKNRGGAAARVARVTGGTRTKVGRRSGVGVKYESYAAFKQALGRSTVDLMGPTAPHMLQAIVVKVDSGGSGTIGIYGPEADRAEGHNVGAGHLPQREFFGASDSDSDEMSSDVERLMSIRMGDLVQ